MNTAHTPGPWSVDLDSIERGADVNDSRGANVCNCFENDAHLIAAAPDLLAALETARETLERTNQGGGYTARESWPDTFAAIDAAIAKAVQS